MTYEVRSIYAAINQALHARMFDDAAMTGWLYSKLIDSELLPGGLREQSLWSSEFFLDDVT